MAGSFLRNLGTDAVARMRGRGGEPVAPPAEQSCGVVISGVGAKVRLATDFGPVPAMLLRSHDKLRTSGGEHTILRRIRMTAFDADMLEVQPGLRAIHIESGSLDGTLPHEDIVVAPHQELSPDRFATSFVIAEELVGRPGILRAGSDETVYHTLHCATEAAVVFAEGVPLRF